MRYYFIFILSGLSLLIERIWNNFWMCFSIILLIVTLSLLNIFSLLPQILNIIALITAYAAISYSFYLACKSFKPITFKNIKRKIEQKNNIKHRPLDAVRDKTFHSSVLWDLHIKSAYDKIKQISNIYAPHFTTSKNDKYALRHIAAISFIVALIATPRESWLSNISNNLTPVINSSIARNSDRNIDLWIQPPAYTNKAALFIKSNTIKLANNSTINIVKGSQIKARANGYNFLPKVKFGDNKFSIDSSNSEKHILTIDAKQSGTLRVEHLYKTLGKWNINIIDDRAPKVALDSAKETAIYSTKLKYNISDDFGINKADAIFKLADSTKDTEKASYKFPINAINSEHEQYYSEDLTAHIWAGKKVELFLRAVDTHNNIVESNAINFTLPEREFSNKFARKIAEYRKMLLEFDNDKLRRTIATSLAEIAIRPDLYKNKFSTFMALSVAVKRIVASKDNKGITNLLWDIALQLEDGGLKTSQQKLYQALQKLQNAISSNALNNLEKQQIVEEVQAAIMDYIRSLSSELQDRLQRGKSLPGLPSKVAERLQNSIDVKEILKKLQNMASSNSFDDISEMAESMKNSLENFDINAFEKMQEQQAIALENINKLEEILSAEQKLFSKTNITKDVEKIKPLATTQKAIKDNLAEVTKALSKSFSPLPENLANAFQAMKLSETNLEMGFGVSAAIHQEKAIKELQKGSNNIADKMAEALKNSILSFSFMPQGNNFGKKHDPLGREIGTDNIKVPTKSELLETKKILEELRKRANDIHKKPAEKEYLERLIH